MVAVGLGMMLESFPTLCGRNGGGCLLKSEVEKYWVMSRENNIYFSYSGKEEREPRKRWTISRHA